MWVRTLTLLCAVPVLAVLGLPQLIANDVGFEYAEVRAMLEQYYRRSAAREGYDYVPEEISKKAQEMGDDGTEASVNRKIWHELFENDILLTLPQAEQLLMEQPPSGRNKRQAQPTPDSFWPNRTISFDFARNEPAWQDLIRSALRHIEDQTCMRFRENGDDMDRLRYFRGGGCYSNVGKVGGRQLVSVGYGCDALGIAAHETLHALGLWHEQSRTDRDEHVNIVSRRIIRGTQGNFERRSVRGSDNMGQPYDLGSVMHYGAKAFTNDWSYNTIETKDPAFQQTIGQREGISFKDAKMINLRYCSEMCRTQLPCENDGYTDPNDCSRCRCPRGYGGVYCESVEYTSCGGELIATESTQTLNSGPVYPTTNCTWRIKSRLGERIQLDFTYVSFPCTDTCKSYVEAKYLKSKTASGARLCCNATQPIYSESGDVVLLFRGDPSMAVGYLGFTVNYRTYGAPDPHRKTPAPVTTTTTEEPTTTTEEPTTTEESVTETPYTTRGWRLTTRSANWGGWGGWSGCTRDCGGCGIRKRVRACFGGDRNCPGSNEETQSCNTQVCSGSETSIMCDGRIVLPCDLMDKLTFGATLASDVPIRNAKKPSDISAKNYYRSKNEPKRFKRSSRPQHSEDMRRYFNGRVKRQSEGFCEKRFSYRCPTRMLTLNLDWKTTAPAEPSRDTPQCCQGYYASNGFCYKD